MRSGMGVSDAFKAWVLKRFPGERGAGGASVLSTRGAEAYMSGGLCDYFVTVGSRPLVHARRTLVRIQVPAVLARGGAGCQTG
jgi:hypothetical protein